MRLAVLVVLAGCRQVLGLTEPAPAADAAAIDGPIDAPSAVGALTVTRKTLSMMDIDLTAEGTLDWAHWGYSGATSVDRMTGGSAIGALATPPALQISAGMLLTASWSNGTPHKMVSATGTGVAVNAGARFQLGVAADTTPHTLQLYVGVQAAQGKITIALADNSAPPFSESVDAAMTENSRYTVRFNAASDAQMLNVTWEDLVDHGAMSTSFAVLFEATLQ